jgi:Double zinc ribbon
VQCPQCQTDNKVGSKFCAACGQMLALTCPQCAFVNEPDDRFCGGCGQALLPTTPTPDRLQEHTPVAYTPKHLADKILTARSALEGERKQVTVLFADTVGFTALARDLDPEVVHEVMDHCFALLTTEVHRFEGTINQYTGDGVMALFDHFLCAAPDCARRPGKKASRSLTRKSHSLCCAHSYWSPEGEGR